MRVGRREGGREGEGGEKISYRRRLRNTHMYIHAINTWLSLRVPLTQNGIVMATRQRDWMANKSQN